MSNNANRALKLLFHSTVIFLGLTITISYAAYRLSETGAAAVARAKIQEPTLPRVATNQVSNPSLATVATSASGGAPALSSAGPEDWTNFEYGMQAPLGEELADFKIHHPDANCIISEGGGLCQLTQLAHFCPSDLACASAAYLFKDGKVVGFQAGYDQKTFEGLEEQLSAKLGAGRDEDVPATHEIHIDRKTTTWKTDVGSFEFSRADGLDNEGKVEKVFCIIRLLPVSPSGASDETPDSLRNTGVN